jgi:hypothetical protein
VGAEEIDLYEKQHSDKSLVEFLRDYAEAGPAWRARVDEAQRELKTTSGICAGRT